MIKGTNYVKATSAVSHLLILFVFLRLQLLMQSFYAEKFNCVIYLYFKAHP